MYLEFYGFGEKPFSLTPDPRFIFLGKKHREAFAHLLYGITTRAGFISLTGEVGSGKTTVLRALLTHLEGDQYRTALIFNPCVSPLELIQTVNRELGVPAAGEQSPLHALNLFLLQQNSEGHTVVLIIDEAQDLEPAVLEQIRLISNLETDREKLIQIILSGQPELLDILEKKEMRQLNQRIAVRYHLEPMDFRDTVEYIAHRLEVATKRGGVTFSRGALKRIYRHSRGLPRIINIACDRALLAGYTKDVTRITSRIAAIGLREIKPPRRRAVAKSRLALASALTLFAVLLAADIYFAGNEPVDETRRRPDVSAGKSAGSTSSAPGRMSSWLAARMGQISESESARRAFDKVADLWNESPLLEGEPFSSPDEIERAAQNRGLRLHRFSGNLPGLERINLPAVLEISLPGIGGKRFVSLLGREEDRLIIDPDTPGGTSISLPDLEKHWLGQGFILWRDPLNLLLAAAPNPRTSTVKRLQELLKEAGAYDGPLTGFYDEETFSAVKRFQFSRGIGQDGIAGPQTLMLLYPADRLETPRLTVVHK